MKEWHEVIAESITREDIVEEAVAALLDEELRAHADGAARCGVRFRGITDMRVAFMEPT